MGCRLVKWLLRGLSAAKRRAFNVAKKNAFNLVNVVSSDQVGKISRYKYWGCFEAYLWDQCPI